MSDARPLMPKATAVWLVENTALTFEQIAEFCQLHMLEIKGIADGDVAAGIRGKDPITGGELSRDEIKRGEAEPGYRLKISKGKVKLPEIKTKKAARYTPTSRRQDRPNAIIWLIKNHPELKDSQIIKLVGTTKPTITQIRERSHWNSANLIPQDPVTLGLCAQTDLDAEVAKGAARVQKEMKANGMVIPAGSTLAPTAETTGYDPAGLNAPQPGVPSGDGGGHQPDPSAAGLGDQPFVGGPVDVARESNEEAAMMEQLKKIKTADAPGTEEQPDIDEVFRNAPETTDEASAADEDEASSSDTPETETTTGNAS